MTLTPATTLRAKIDEYAGNIRRSNEYNAYTALHGAAITLAKLAFVASNLQNLGHNIETIDYDKALKVFYEWHDQLDSDHPAAIEWRALVKADR